MNEKEITQSDTPQQFVCKRCGWPEKKDRRFVRWGARGGKAKVKKGFAITPMSVIRERQEKARKEAEEKAAE